MPETEPELEEKPASKASKKKPKKKTTEATPERVEPTSRPAPDRNIDQIPGVGPTMVKLLSDQGIKSLFSLALQRPKDLAEIKGISAEGAGKLIIAAKKALGKEDTISGAEMLLQMKTSDIVSTGSESFDTLLGGGVKTGESYHFWGEYRAGKTEACLQVSVNALRPQAMGGFGEDTLIYWIATERFPARRALQMIQAYEFWQGDPEPHDLGNGLTASDKQMKLMENFVVKKCSSSDEQMKAGKDLYTFIDEFPSVRIVVVDSLTAHFRAEYVGRALLAPRQQNINTHIHDLKETAALANAALIFTNQVLESPDISYGDPKKPSGGHVVKHNIENVVKFRKARENSRVVQLIDAQDLPEGEASFHITPEGVRD